MQAQVRGAFERTKRGRAIRAGAHRAAVALFGMLLACLGCSDAQTAHTADTTEEGAPACHASQLRTDGACCPAGHFYDFSANSCVAVGPPECAALAFGQAESCVPRWCWHGESDNGGACDPVAQDDCPMVGRLCTADELVAGAGCGAGTGPDPHNPDACLPAGSFPGSGVPADWDGDPLTLPAVPSVGDGAPGNAPPVTALTDIEDTFFCRNDLASDAHFCSPAEMEICKRGTDGALPPADRCVHVGVPWPSRFCPPGFVVDTAAPVGAGLLPPCKPDPADCPAGEYAGASAGDADVFVHGTSGDDTWPGTMAKPVKTIGKALLIAPVAGVVVVAPGTYSESVVISKAVSLRGHCAAQVSVIGAQGKAVVAIKGKTTSAAAQISGLQVSGSWFGVEVSGSLPAHLQRVFVAAASLTGVYVSGKSAVVKAASLVVMGTTPFVLDKGLGWGVSADSGCHVTLEDTRLSANRDVGLAAIGAGTTVVASRILVDGTLPQELDKKFGWGVLAQDGAKLTLDEARLSGNRVIGLKVANPGSTVAATGLLIDATLPQQVDNVGGRGAEVSDGAQVTLSEARLSANRDVGLAVSGAATRLTASSLLIDGTQARATDQQFGLGMNVQGGARATVQGARLSANRTVGLVVTDAGSEVAANQLLVDGTLQRASDAMFGTGIQLRQGASLLLQDARLSANRQAGLVAGDKGTVVVANRLVVDGTLPQASDSEVGRGVGVQHGARATLRGVRVSANTDVGVTVAHAGSELAATRLLVDATLPQATDQKFGRGVSIQGGAKVELLGTRLVANRETSLYVYDASVRLVGVAVAATSGDGFGDFGGTGVSVVGGGVGSILASRIAANRGVALEVVNSTVEVRGSAVLATLWGTSPKFALAGVPSTETTTLADGILLNGATDTVIERCVLAGNQRAGVVIDSSPATQVTRTLVDAGGTGLYGLVVQDSKDALDDQNAIFGAVTQNYATDAGLSLPQPPAPVGSLAQASP